MFVALALLAAIGTRDMPPTLQADFLAGRYGAMVQRVDSLLASPEALTLTELSLLHVWKGFALTALGDRLAARASFAAALSLDPSLELDPREVSPKIVAEFEAARTSLEPRQHVPVVSYLIVEDTRPRAALRSMIAPGWGQWTMGRKTRGAVFATAAVGTLTGWLVAGEYESDAHHRYLTATEDDIAPAYATYNRAFKIRRGLGYAVLAVWAGAVADILVGPSNVRIVARESGIGLSTPLK